jgi:hypothetical protein
VAAACSTFDAAPESAGDAGGGIDGGADGRAEADGTSPSDAGSEVWVPCSMRGSPDPSHFCDDFDRGGAISFGWNDLVDSIDSAAELFMTGTSRKIAFRARLLASPSPPGRAQLLLKRTPPPSSYRIEFDVRVDAIPHEAGSPGYSHLVVLQFADAPCFTGTTKQRGIELSLYASSQRVALFEKGLQTCPGDDASAPSTSDEFAVTPAQLVDGNFHHVSVTLAKGPCPGTASTMSLFAAIDDLKPACRGLAVDAFAESPTIDAYLGPYVGASGYAETVYVYDNVTIDLE